MSDTSKNSGPIIDLSALGVIDQSRAYEASRTRAIDNPGSGVSVRFKMNKQVREIVEAWLDNPNRGFQLAC